MTDLPSALDRPSSFVVVVAVDVAVAIFLSVVVTVGDVVVPVQSLRNM